ncbi:hypothetical protein O181_074572 [Austropuccinia psidii MF-1]|uniref:Uncharacterized protein n=1 Tax=Austropuccinia psidii MF-1 TaxID=1389203 RepID=A0A9Q3FDA5_9BASI|nr:hypothetical protein [Austropuccinia psidii MF-1]
MARNYKENGQKNFNRKLEDSASEHELPKITYKKIDNNSETCHILVEGNDNINGNTLKTKRKRRKVRSSQNHELSDEEIINGIEKYLKIMEEREKHPKATYNINFIYRPLNNQEEAYEWKLEIPEFIQKTPNEED